MLASGSDAGGNELGAFPLDPWEPGDYPRDATSGSYLTLPNLDGQRGFVRRYKAHVPPSYRKDQPMPLVFCLHGLFQDTTMFCVSGSEMVQLSDRENFILVMPLGHAGSWNAGRCCGEARDMSLDDVELVRGIFAELETHLNIARNRVFAVGFANGGFMTYRLACEAADIFSAVAIGSGGLGVNSFPDTSLAHPDLLSTRSDFETCKPAHPVSILHIHGSLDELVPASLQPKSLEHLAASAGCASTTAALSDRSRGDTSCSSFDGCPAEIEMTGCTVEGGGHCWFGKADCGTGADAIGALFAGANSSVMDNNTSVIDFFKRHGL